MHWKDLSVWQKTHELVIDIYKLVQVYPNSEKFGIVDQLKRAASSVPANIVEGQSRNTTADYLRFLYNARGSLEEVRYFLILSMDLGFISNDAYAQMEEKCTIASKLLNGLIKSLKQQSSISKN